ncbi:MAG TPA: sigma factor-like helix-turn-helix DNA-binding protein [Candidatus Obscuribacterales bacterium]
MLDRLSEPLAKVLVLHVQGLSFKEIAELTGANIGTVRSRLHYARKRARQLMKKLP